MRKVFCYFGSTTHDYRALMRDQQDLILDGQHIPISRLVIADQTHSDITHICKINDSGAGLGNNPQIPIVDGLATDIEGQFLLVRTADCTPVILYEASGKAVSAIHSGREGTRKNIVGKAVRQLVDHYQCSVSEIIAYIGPGICIDHYEVSEIVYESFNEALREQNLTSYTQRHRHLDIRATIFKQLIQAGISFKNIENINICTYENMDYFSFRRDGTKNRQINIVGIINE